MPAPVLATRGRAGSGTVAFLLAAAVLPPYGCSFLAVKPPPEHPAFLERVDCTTSYSAPTADILLGVVQLVVAVGIAGSGSTYVGANQRDLVARTEAILAGAQTGAAIWGFRKVRACNDLMESQRPFNRGGTRDPTCHNLQAARHCCRPPKRRWRSPKSPHRRRRPRRYPCRPHHPCASRSITNSALQAPGAGSSPTANAQAGVGSIRRRFSISKSPMVKIASQATLSSLIICWRSFPILRS